MRRREKKAYSNLSLHIKWVHSCDTSNTALEKGNPIQHPARRKSQILMDDSGPPSVEVITLTQGRPGLANPHKREVQVLIFMRSALQQGILTLARSRLATGRRQCRGMLFRIAQPTEREREREGERRSRGMRLRLTRELSLSTENQNDRFSSLQGRGNSEKQMVWRISFVDLLCN